MKLTLSALSLTLMLSVVALAGDYDKCVCPSKDARTVAWCKPCKGGVIFTHKTTSRKLVEALQGKEVDLAKMKCPGCKEAAQKSGSCCGKRFVDNKAFKSPVAATLARGHVVEESKVACDGCRSAFKAGKGYCAHCNAGIVHGLAFKSREDFDAAVQAHTILARAITAVGHCEACAVAMVTDGECSHCKVKFENGESRKTG